MEFNFVLPTNSQQLLNSERNEYYVRRIYGADEIPAQLKGGSIETALQNQFNYGQSS